MLTSSFTRKVAATSILTVACVISSSRFNSRVVVTDGGAPQMPDIFTKADGLHTSKMDNPILDRGGNKMDNPILDPAF